MSRRKRKKFKQFNFRLNPRFVWVGSFCLLAIILLSCLVYSIYSSSVFKLTEGSIESDLPLSRSLKEKIKGKSLFVVDIESISYRLIKEYPEYKEIYILKKFPSSLIIKAKKKKVFAQIKARRFFPIDKEAMVIGSGSKIPLPGVVPIEINDYKHSLKKGKVVELGSEVTIKRVKPKAGEDETYTIVGSTEADPLNQRISNESPIGEALLDHKVGDEVEAQVPAGKVAYKIIKLK